MARVSACLVPRRLSSMCAQRKAGRRQRASVPFPWSLAVHHQSLAFRARLCHAKNEAPEEEAALALCRPWLCPSAGTDPLKISAARKKNLCFERAPRLTSKSGFNWSGQYIFNSWERASVPRVIGEIRICKLVARLLAVDGHCGVEACPNSRVRRSIVSEEAHTHRNSVWSNSYENEHRSFVSFPTQTQSFLCCKFSTAPLEARSYQI